MDKTAQVHARKGLSAPGLLDTIRCEFSKIPDTRNGHGKAIGLCDALMSGVAVFGMKHPSLLQFDQKRDDPAVVHNLKTLYGVEKAPSDTRMRELLDHVNPRDLRPAFKKVFAQVQRGKALDAFHVDGDAVLVSIDGTGYFQSHEVHCDQCCVKQHKDGTVSYYHQMLGAAIVHPDCRNVIPLCPEAIVKQDGATKNDSERNASKRLIEDLRREHPLLKMIILEDSLSSNAPHITCLKEQKMGFILSVKPGDHKALFNLVDDMEALGGVKTHEISDRGITQKYRFVNNVPLNEQNNEMTVNFLEFWELKKGKILHFSWVTDSELSKSNVEKIMRRGRARWKIENETFNTLKNQGYEFEHNFGHGNQNLSVVLAYLMLLAFLIDQVQEMACKMFQAAKNARINKRALWWDVRSLFVTIKLASWQQLYAAIAKGYNIEGFSVSDTS